MKWKKHYKLRRKYFHVFKLYKLKNKLNNFYRKLKYFLY